MTPTEHLTQAKAILANSEKCFWHSIGAYDDHHEWEIAAQHLAHAMRAYKAAKNEMEKQS